MPTFTQVGKDSTEHCTIDGCTRPLHCKGLCYPDYANARRLIRNAEKGILPRPQKLDRCSARACTSTVYATGLCKSHYEMVRRLKNNPPPQPRIIQQCTVEGCESDVYGKGLCSLHWQRWRKTGEIGGPRRRAVHGSGYTDPDGYVWVGMKGHPNATKTGKIAQHTVVMSKMIGRPLFKHETVHHKNGIRSDNDENNLELWSKSQPAGQRVDDKIAWAIEFLNQYGYQVEQV